MNGAPPLPAKAATSDGSRTVFIIIGVIVVVLLAVAVLGIVAAIAVPNFLTATQRAKQRRTMADIRTFATAVEAYASDNNEYPRTTDVLSPKYVKRVPTVDGWGNAFDYACQNDETGRCARYYVASRGKDGRFENGGMHPEVPEASRGTVNFDCDIVYANGQFVEYPEGAQH